MRLVVVVLPVRLLCVCASRRSAAGSLDPQKEGRLQQKRRGHTTWLGDERTGRQCQRGSAARVQDPPVEKEEGEGDKEGAVPEGGTLRPWTESDGDGVEPWFIISNEPEAFGVRDGVVDDGP